MEESLLNQRSMTLPMLAELTFQCMFWGAVFEANSGFTRWCGNIPSKLGTPELNFEFSFEIPKRNSKLRS